MQTCCLRTANAIARKPAHIILNRSDRNYTNNKCYLNQTACCDNAISREHYIPNIILKALSGGDFGSKGLNFAKNSWLGNKKATFVPYSNIVAKILCKFHNNSLSILDQSLGQLVRFILHLTATYKPDDVEAHELSYLYSNKLLLVNGHDIERALAKLFAGLLYSGAFPFEQMGPLAATFRANVEREITEIRPANSAGLWIQDNQFEKGYEYNELGLGMMLADLSGHETLVGVRLVVGSVSLIYLAFEHGVVEFEGEGGGAIHRPIVFASSGARILFSWHVPKNILDKRLFIDEIGINPGSSENSTNACRKSSICLENGRLMVDPFS